MGYIMYKGQSIDCSYFLGKDSSFAHFGIPKEDAPESSFVTDEMVQSGNIRLPILWFNEKYKQKYYISCTKVNDDDIPIGILLHKSSSDVDLNSYKTIDGYRFGNKLTFASVNYLDANNINGSKQIVRNLSYGDNIKKLSYDYLKGYTHDTKNPLEYGIDANIWSSVNDSISNTQTLWDFYDTENKDWKTDPEFITYAKSCFLYSTPGTKQGDWKMIDLNFANYNQFNSDAVFLNRSLTYLGTESMSSDMLTAFTSINVHPAEEHGSLPVVVGVLSGWNSNTWRDTKIDTVDYNDKLAGFAELTLPADIFAKVDAPKSYLFDWAYGRSPILWYNPIYKEKYYISPVQVQGDDIPIGILLPKYGKGGDTWPNKEAYLFDDKFTFVSINYLDANNPKGSNSPIGNIPYGNINPEWEWDYLRGFQPGTIPTEYEFPDPSKYDISLHRLDTLYEAIDNTEKLWNYYDEINPGWKTDPEFNTYAKSCYLYSTPGTKQGDWKMMDMNYGSYMGAQIAYQTLIYNTRQYLGIDVGGISGLTAFVYLNFHNHDDPYVPHVIGAILGGAKLSEMGAGFNDVHVCEAELTLPASIFKFDD